MNPKPAILLGIPLSGWVRGTAGKMEVAGKEDAESWGACWRKTYFELGGKVGRSAARTAPPQAAYALWRLGRISGSGRPLLYWTPRKVLEDLGEHAAYALLCLRLLEAGWTPGDRKALAAEVEAQCWQRFSGIMQNARETIGVTTILYTEGQIVPLPCNWDRESLEAAAQGDWHELQCAVEKGADVNARDEQGITALMRAVGRGDRLEMVQYLVEHGADVAARDPASRTALDFLTYPEEPSEEWENAHEAWTHSEESYIDAYLEPSKTVETRSPSQTAKALQATVEPPLAASGLSWLLFAAIRRGALGDVAGILDTDKADVNVTDEGGWTPLMRATAADQLEIMRLLLERGADSTFRDQKGLSALSVASPEARAVLHQFLPAL
jgi:hypothetical protein